ncbi:hypothetical protein RRG08_005898 [Elysia crispata]|uniref:PiggyBac transposable element-derived protein domain-containing protein n=1 Tax=Elysia crispata TaxID=231223 RepID=A0AAE0Y502_9GAST|nr:hypothetical protein RRG08_005898 [Elysia crispata]
MTNFHAPNEAQTTLRWNKDGTPVEMTQPKLVQQYNQYMGGCDLNDQMTPLHRSRRHYRWPGHLFIKFVVWASYNSYILFIS